MNTSGKIAAALDLAAAHGVREFAVLILAMEDLRDTMSALSVGHQLGGRMDVAKEFDTLQGGIALTLAGLSRTADAEKLELTPAQAGASPAEPAKSKAKKGGAS